MDDKQHELLEDAVGSGMSSCCSARVYAPSEDWARCIGCMEMCDVVIPE